MNNDSREGMPEHGKYGCWSKYTCQSVYRKRLRLVDTLCVLIAQFARLRYGGDNIGR